MVKAVIKAETDLKRQGGKALRFKWKSSVKPLCANYISYDLTLGTKCYRKKKKNPQTEISLGFTYGN